MPTECMNLSDLTLAEAGGKVRSGGGGGMEDASWERRQRQREEGRGDLGNVPGEWTYKKEN